MNDAQFAFGFDRALGSRPAPGQIQTRFLRGFNALVCSLGADPRSILERHNIDPAAFVDPDNQVECLPAANLLEYCGTRLDDPVFGLRLADRQTPDVFGPVAALARAAPTFRQSIECLIEYLPVFHSPEGQVEIAEGPATTEVRWTARSDLNRIPQAKLHGFVLMLKTLQMLGGSEFEPFYLRVGFELDRPAAQALRERAGCRVHHSEINAVAFASDLLDQPIASSNTLVYELLGTYLARASGAPQPSLADRIEAYIRTALPFGTCTIERCAPRLGMSTRGLQKRLTRLGLSFSALVERERAELAKGALRDSEHTLSEIAMTLGYSDQTCFGRAFKRWTGFTPQGYRMQQADAIRHSRQR